MKPMLGNLGPMLGLCWAYAEPKYKDFLRLSWKNHTGTYVVPMLGSFGAMLGQCWANRCLCWAYVEPFAAYVGPMVGHLVGFMGFDGSFWREKLTPNGKVCPLMAFFG